MCYEAAFTAVPAKGKAGHDDPKKDNKSSTGGGHYYLWLVILPALSLLVVGAGWCSMKCPPFLHFNHFREVFFGSESSSSNSQGQNSNGTLRASYMKHSQGNSHNVRTVCS